MIPIATRYQEDTLLGFGYYPGIDISDPGYAIPVEWASVVGATGIEVASALLLLRPSVVVETQTDVPFQADGSGWVVTVPANRRVAAIGLQGFKRPGEPAITSAAGLPAGRRISVAFPPVERGGFDTPRFSAPPVDAQGAVPSTLTGATYSNGTLQLSPATLAAKARIALVNGGTPSEFSDDPTELSEVSLTTHAAARNMQVVGPAGEVLWQMPEFDPDAADAEVDLKHGLTAALNLKLNDGQPLQAEFLVKATPPARAVVSFEGAHGSVLRAEEGVVRTVLEGDPVAIALSGPLDPSTPASAKGDLTIRYDGIRIFEEASDELPEAADPVQGVVVGEVPALRVFPPQAFAGIEPARVGIYGRAPESCEVSIEFVEVLGNSVGMTLSPPAVLRIEPDNEVKTRWAELPAGILLDRPAGLRVRANTGRFYWSAGKEAQPIVRLAIVDPEPAGRSLYLGAAQLANVDGLETHQAAFSFPTNVLSGAIPSLRSDLFLTVDISDLTLRYAR